MSDDLDDNRAFLLQEALSVVRTLRRELAECDYEVVDNGDQEDIEGLIDPGPWLMVRWPGHSKPEFRFDLGLRERVLSDGLSPDAWKEYLAERLDEWAFSILRTNG